MYQCASKIPRPFSLPLIGSALPFMGKSLDTSSIITTLFRTYPGIFKVWFGPKLMVGVSDPKYLEILLPNCIEGILDVWKRHRKILTPTFNQKILNSFTLGTFRKKAFLDYLIEITSEGSSKFTDQELTDEVTTFIIAGSDTTATTNSFVFITLGLHQDMQQKIHEEVMEVVGPSRQVEPADLPHLKYMEMFIKETLRIFPVATLILRDIDVDVDLGDYVIPAGTTAMFGMPWIHTDERHWPDPYKFDPDRFLPEEVSKRDRLAYIPFSYGPRNCIVTNIEFKTIRMKYAMMAMKTLLSTIISKYRISTSYKNVKDVNLKCNMITRPRDGFKFAVELRSPSDRQQSREMGGRAFMM
ncbi:hypothetical protein NQ318_005771 [Aromia moschata]|uniref:Cytochrome P450 n=1 Tax=Aromia moschata TaxID=1265417 RepID=A0AAV8YTH8_9CUCU|nr:hypothetical protein NQ318_005771 [Aromia moschata]